MCTVWGNTLSVKLVLKSKQEIQEHLPNHQETEWNEAFPCDRKTNLQFFEWTRWLQPNALKNGNEFSLYERRTVSCTSTDPKTSGSFLERQFTSFCINSPCNVLKVKTFLLFKQTKPRVCARSRRTRSPKWGSYETGFFNTGWSLLLPQTVKYKPTNIVFMKWKLGVSDSTARLIGQ